MSTLIPTACGCHTLQSPPIEKDDRLNLHVRTGSASILYNSFVFTFGGLTIGLELDGNVSIDFISTIFMRKITNNKSSNISRYLSGEMFFLDLISRAWSRVPIPVGRPRPKPRLFHEIATGKGCLYVFGGLVISENNKAPGKVYGSDADAFQLVPCNDLWEFNLLTKSWMLLHDGSGWETNPLIPCPRYTHKLATIDHLTFVNKRDHFGILIAGGRDANSARIYKNSVYDFVDKCYVDAGPPLKYPPRSNAGRKPSGTSETENSATTPKTPGNPEPSNASNDLSINYLDSSVVSFTEEAEADPVQANPSPCTRITSKPSIVESLFIYAPTDANSDQELHNPIMTCRLGKQIYPPKVPPLWKKQGIQSKEKNRQYVKRTVPYNLRYPTGGLFGQNLVLIGFLANDYDISIFIYNKPTGKWSRLNIFCHHEYGSHRFWGGFVWSSHHKVVLLGNYVTSQTTSSVRYFSSMITVSLPVTNILASMELAGGNIPGKISHHTASSDMSSMSDALSSTSGEELMSETDSSRRGASFSQNNEDHTPKATFSDYVHYAAPKVKFTKVRSTFPPAAITLGRNALRYGDLISDFELISSNGDRIPVCLSILKERWGKYFIDLLARAYVKAVDSFEHDEIHNNSDSKLGSLKSSRGSGSVDSDLDKQMEDSSSLNGPPAHETPTMKDPFQKDMPQFRLPFQDNSSVATEDGTSVTSREIPSVDPFKQNTERRNSQISNLSGTSVLKYHLKEIPSQLPLPKEPIPDISAAPVSFRSNSRKNSSDFSSPRGSLLHTLTALRNLPTTKSSKDTSRESPLPTSPESGTGSHERLIDEVVVKAGEVAKGQKENESQDQKEEKAEKEHEVSKDEKVNGFTKGDKENDDKERSARTSEDTSLDIPRDSNSSSYSPNLQSSPIKSRSLLDMQKIDVENFSMEPSLIPRKLYIPFASNSVKAFAEYFYTGQIGNKWPLHPCTLDCFLMSRYFRVPLLYDLICEVLYGIIGRKEALVLEEGKLYKRKFKELFNNVGVATPETFRFPLDEYADFMDSVDDGYMDIALLRKSSNVHKLSTSSGGSKRKSSVRTADILLSPINEPKGEAEREGEKGETDTEQEKEENDGENDGNYKEENDTENGEGESKSPRDTSNTSNAGYTPPVKDTAQAPPLKEGTPVHVDDSTSASDEELPGMHYLDYSNTGSIPGIRYKSVFDKTVYDTVNPANFNENKEGPSEVDNLANLTLEMLVSPDQPQPSNYVIDLILDIASVCTDVKLMLRSMNARQMGLSLEQTKKDYLALCQKYETELNQTPQANGEAQVSPGTGKQGEPEMPQLASKKSSTMSVSTLKSIPVTLPSLKGESSTPEEKTTSSEKMKVTPFKEQKSESLESNRKLDRHIAQMIKKDERKKLKAVKEEKEKSKTSRKVPETKSDSTTPKFSREGSSSNVSLSTTGRIGEQEPKMSRLKKFGNRFKYKMDSSGSALHRSNTITSFESSYSKRSNTSKLSESTMRSFFGKRK